ncbi:MAG: 6-phosphogluconate dehydrogenase, NAD-binding [Betaproteobacteria bacterium]|nr:6-phosphogluconate dehydrogenase, NAD-binding [Betaproteobacteria bacterium]
MTVQLKKIGITSIGDMGLSVAGRLKACGFEVYTSLEGRSERTAGLTRKAGVADCGSIENLVKTCDAVLSILDPSAAVAKGREIADAIKATGKRIVFVDCNAISPDTAHEIDGFITKAGGISIDGGILRVTVGGKQEIRLYVSGPDATILTQIVDDQLRIHVVGEQIGNASGLKMCYGAFTKGALALGMELFLTAGKLGVIEHLEAEMKESQPEVYKWILGRAVGMAPKAYRYAPEMLEGAKTFEEAGFTPRMLQGAADMFEWIAKTPLAGENLEQAREKGRTGREIMHALIAGKA